MSYSTHFRFSTWVAVELLKGAAKALVHAIFPFVLGSSTTHLIATLSREIKKAGCVE